MAIHLFDCTSSITPRSFASTRHSHRDHTTFLNRPLTHACCDLSPTVAPYVRMRTPTSMINRHSQLQSYQPFQTNFGHLGYHCRSRCLALPFRGPSIPEGCLEEDPIRKSIVYTKDPLLNVLFLIVPSTSPSPPPSHPCLPTLWINANLAPGSSIVHPACRLSETLVAAIHFPLNPLFTCVGQELLCR